MNRGMFGAASLTALLLSALGPAPAFAAEEGGLYLGAGAGQFNVEIDDVNTADEVIESFDSDDTSWKVFGGWRFGRYFAAELDWIDLGNPEETVNNVNVDAEIDGFAPYLLGTLPLGPVELFAKAGYYFYDITVNGRSLGGSVDDSNEDFVYGAGIGLTLFDHLHARLEYEIIDISEIDDANAIWLSGAWRF
ncbi:MAG TPA: outer membrane beta-barrel protein [Steroidobacter sp.]|nr:outer membrane beta-barrel protein [Steroidobacter sp.]